MGRISDGELAVMVPYLAIIVRVFATTFPPGPPGGGAGAVSRPRLRQAWQPAGCAQ